MDIRATWRTAAEFDPLLAVSDRMVPALAAKRLTPRHYTREALFDALYDSRPVVFDDFRVPVHCPPGARLEEVLPAIIRRGFRRGQRARVQMGPSRSRSTLLVPEVVDRWQRARAIVSVTDLHVREHRIEQEIGIEPLSDFNLLLCGSEAMAEQEMMTMVISSRANVTDSHSDDPDGSNHCFVGRKLWLAWDTFEGKAAGLEDNSRDELKGDAAFDLDAFLSLRSSLWWTVSAGETLFLAGHLTHRVITLERYLGIGSFFVAFPSAIQTIARWNLHGPLWGLQGDPEKQGLVDEIAVAATKKILALRRQPAASQERWGLGYAARAAKRWRRVTPRAVRDRLLRNRPFADLVATASGRDR